MSVFNAAIDKNQNHSMLAVQGTAGTADTAGTSQTIPIGADPKTGAVFTYDIGSSGTSVAGGKTTVIDGTTTASVVYIGKTSANYGSTQYGSALWQITKIDSSTTDVTLISLANSGASDQIWDARGTLTYTL